jgi:ribosomal-protein-alanine N-acetyltransferase
VTGTDALLAPMRWWHIPAVMVLEDELFGAEAWSAASFWSELADPETRHYVVALAPGPAAEAAADPDLLGYAGLAAYGGDAHVLTLGVALAAQRRGLGTALLRDLLGAAGRARAREVYLDVRADNPVAQRLYSRHGFVPIGVRRRYYQPSGVDAVVMRRDSDAAAPAARRGRG